MENASKDYDVIIIGGGNAGFAASKELSANGKRLAFIEQRDFGGTCPNRGCTPKKVLVAAAHALDEISKADQHCITVGKPELDWGALISRKDEMIGFIPNAMEGVAAKRGDVYRGAARFVGAKEIDVDGTRLQAEHIIIATGSTPRALDFPGSEHLITSETVLSSKDKPSEVIFVGGGVVALEFSHVYARAGVHVTILEAAPRLLPRFEKEAAEQLRLHTESLGVRIVTNVRIESIEKSSEGLNVTYSVEKDRHTRRASHVVNGAGRVANVAGLDLQAAGIEHDGIRIAVSKHLESLSSPGVWVCGDALVGSAQLSPLATHEGEIVGRNIVNQSRETPDYTAVPSAVYTVPALASVGLTEEQAREKTSELRVATNDMTGWFSGKSYAEKVAWCKVLIDEKTDRILGAHLLGHHGDDLIHLFALAMKHDISVSALKSQIFAFPSFSSDIKNLL